MKAYSKCPDNYIFGLDIGTRSIVGTVGYRENENKFVVVAQVIKKHETRAMLDGQIHDINKVAETIYQVKSDLEELLQYKLEEVCIAAAGRVLKTVMVHVDYEYEEEKEITEEDIHTLELLGIEKAYHTLNNKDNEKLGLYCVGSSVIHYYLNEYIILNLEGHRGGKIGADLLATFLPDEVIESLYAAVDRAGLKVANLTLEPIAASEVAIPVNFRLLNIALVDVGAGTSDISITKDGSIIGYGMIAAAGDEFTEELAKRYLVDFTTAENIKIDAFEQDEVTYQDIMGISHTIAASEVLNGLSNTVKKITSKIAEKIKELNGGNSVSAVFIVGGGGKLPEFAESLAEFLELPSERVAVRGAEVLGSIEFMQEVEKDSTLVTPVGICLSYYSKNNNFIMVSVNERQVKLYDNNKLTVMDAAIQIGFPKENIFPKRGKEIEFTINGEKRLIRGEAGEGAKITINSKSANFNTKITKDDIIEIIPSTRGQDAAAEISSLAEFKRKGKISIQVNGRKITCPRVVYVNDKSILENYTIQSGDNIEIVDYCYINQLMEFMDMPKPISFTVNNQSADLNTRIFEEFSVECEWGESLPVSRQRNEEKKYNKHEKQNESQKNTSTRKKFANSKEYSRSGNFEIKKGNGNKRNQENQKEIVKKNGNIMEKDFASKRNIENQKNYAEKRENTNQKAYGNKRDSVKQKDYTNKRENVNQKDYAKKKDTNEINYKSRNAEKNLSPKNNETKLCDITISVNGQSVVLQNKENYIFVDILDFYPFDTTVAGGTELITTVNGMTASFTTKVKQGDKIELYWKD